MIDERLSWANGSLLTNQHANEVELGQIAVRRHFSWQQNPHFSHSYLFIYLYPPPVFCKILTLPSPPFHFESDKFSREKREESVVKKIRTFRKILNSLSLSFFISSSCIFFESLDVFLWSKKGYEWRLLINEPDLMIDWKLTLCRKQLRRNNPGSLFAHSQSLLEYKH